MSYFRSLSWSTVNKGLGNNWNKDADIFAINKGNGIKGMEQRVKELDGFFSCGSPDGEGFNLHVTIPIIRELSNINNVDII